MQNRVLINSLSVLIVLAIAGAYFWIDSVAPYVAYFTIFFLILGFFMLTGKIVNQQLFGILIDSRNKVSLSRLQLVLWTLVVLSGFFVMGLLNTANLASTGASDPGPLDITVPQEVWWLLGISTTSLVGSPLLKSYREEQSATGSTPAPVSTSAPVTEAVAATTDTSNNADAEATPAPAPVATTPGTNGTSTDNTGKVIHKNTTADKASFWDIFMGEESTNYKSVDVAKLQMLFFSLITVVSYTIAVIVQIKTGSTFSFPDINAGLVTLMGISHAGYLTNKGIPK